MIDPKNQIIYVKGKRVEFDSLPSALQEKLLTLWGKTPKTVKNDTRKDNAAGTIQGESTAKTKGSNKKSS